MGGGQRGFGGLVGLGGGGPMGLGKDWGSSHRERGGSYGGFGGLYRAGGSLAGGSLGVWGFLWG